MLRPGARNMVRLTLPPSLAAIWLMPQLGAFEREHPEVELQLVPTTWAVDLLRDQVDLAVRHGKAAWPGIDADFARGTLVAPLGAGDPTGAAYHLCRPADLPPTPVARRLERWLRALAATT